MKKIIVLFLSVLLLCGCTKLPSPQVSEGQRGQLGIDKNINEDNIDKYLNIDGAIYRDVRMLIDDGNYEAIGGDSYLSGFVKGFEVVPYPYLAPLTGLPEEVGKGYNGKTLFSVDDDGNFVANYDESIEILEYLFPKDKIIFIMCGGGGYAGMTKNLLVNLGWNENKIYNVGGYWNYNGKNNVQVKNENGSYSFWKVNYHNIDFTTLHEVK